MARGREQPSHSEIMNLQFESARWVAAAPFMDAPPAAWGAHRVFKNRKPPEKLAHRKFL